MLRKITQLNHQTSNYGQDVYITNEKGEIKETTEKSPTYLIIFQDLFCFKH